MLYAVSCLLDLHSHYLPSLDDGAPDLAESLAMARAAAAAGVTRVYCTPHQFDGAFENPRAAVLAAVEAWRAELAKAGIALEARPGGEAHLTPELLERLDRGEIATYGDAGRAVLLELPHGSYPPGTDEAVFGLQRRGLAVVWAHPERNQAVLRRPELAWALADRGVIPQLTAASLAGIFGPGPRRLAVELKARAACVVASDGHRSRGARSCVPPREVRLECPDNLAALLGP